MLEEVKHGVYCVRRSPTLLVLVAVVFRIRICKAAALAPVTLQTNLYQLMFVVLCQTRLASWTAKLGKL